MSLNQMMMQNIAFTEKGSTNLSLIQPGVIRSVEEKEVKIKESQSRILFTVFGGCEKYQMATPDIAII